MADNSQQAAAIRRLLAAEGALRERLKRWDEAAVLQTQEALMQSTVWVVTANSIWGSAENQTPIAAFTRRANLDAYIAWAKLPEMIFTDHGDRRMGRTYRQESLLWDYNGQTAGDWHPPDSSFGTLCVNPCIYETQYRELPVPEGMTIGDHVGLGDYWLPVDPAPVKAAIEAAAG